MHGHGPRRRSATRRFYCRARSSTQFYRQKNNEHIHRIVRVAGIASSGCVGGVSEGDSAAKSALSTSDFPTAPVRLIEPFGAGGGVDTIARAFAPKLSGLWHQPVTVENHTGAGRSVAPALVAKARPDGYTLLVNSSAQAYAAILRQDLPSRSRERFHPGCPANQPGLCARRWQGGGPASVAELVSRARAKPDALKFGSPGMGSGAHFGVLRFNLEAKIRAVHVPDDSIAAAIARHCRRQNRLPSRTHSSCLDRHSLWQPRAARRQQRASIALVAGCTDRGGGWDRGLRLFDLVRSLGTSRNSSVRSRQACSGRRRVLLRSPDLVEWLTNHGGRPMKMTQPEFARFVRSETETAARTIDPAGLRQR